jgi:hypothetical protein
MIASTIVVVPPCHVLLIRAAHSSRVKSSTAAREHRGTPGNTGRGGRFRSPGQRVRLTGAQAVSLRPMPQGATRADVGLVGRRCPEGCQKAALFCADAFPARRGSFGMRRCLAPTPTADARGRSLTRTLRSLRPLALSGDFDSAMRRFESCRPSHAVGSLWRVYPVHGLQRRSLLTGAQGPRPLLCDENP